MSPPNPQERAARFIGALRQLAARNDRGALAALRRGMSPATVMDAWPAVARLGGDIGQPGASIFVDVAALFATHPLESKVTNFGDTCRTVASDNMGRIIESHERRFRRLLASDSVGDLTTQLRVWVRLASSKGIGVNYESLFYDLWKWRWDADGIRVKWARSFWHSGNHEAKDTTLTETAPKDSVSREA